MTYPNSIPARFLSRPNRFVAQVELDGVETTVHVKNTGRCRELLVPGARVWLVKSDNPSRKTAYDLVAVEKGDRLINMDSQAPNAVFGEWAQAGCFVPGLTLLKPEYKHGDSRFDFYWEAGDRKGFVEVKGVTLEQNGAVY
ncbi:DNA/RNA nuclease SfsA, partial [Evtepia sp.]|uniref:DNA/RNA nuclease SfsA n=1 Tax=Evtepia sp. TaxID=2773933 RepID=UPI002A7FF384